MANDLAECTGLLPEEGWRPPGRVHIRITVEGAYERRALLAPPRREWGCTLLQVVPSLVGRMLTRARPGLDHLAMYRPEVATSRTFPLQSPSLQACAALPERYTADGSGLSPALEWRGAPEDTSSLALIVEDADSPSREPLVHAIAWVIGRSQGVIREGALNPTSDWALPTLGRNSYLRPRYLAPDPPPGHGPHRYVFQMFALDCSLHIVQTPGRRAMLQAMTGHVLAVGHLQVTYERR